MNFGKFVLLMGNAHLLHFETTEEEDALAWTGPSKESQELLRHAGQPFGQHAEEVSWLSIKSPTHAVPISGQEVGLAVV